MTLCNSLRGLNIIRENSSFRLHVIEGYISNIYLVEYPDSMLLLDSGSINDADKIVHYCERICRRPMTDISLCAVTHMHPDHAGGAAFLRSRYGIPIAAFHNIDRWYRGITGFIQHQLDCRMEQFVSRAIGRKREPVLFSRRLRPDYRLNDNDHLPFFADWKALHIPGHTLHDIALYHEADKILHSGDAILKVKGKYSMPIPVFFKRAMKNSYQRLSQLHAEIILPGHGEYIESANTAEIFEGMMQLISEPRTYMSRMAHMISLFTPAVWKGMLKNFLHRLSCH